MRALTIIERHQALTLGSLASELGAIPSSATRLCDRLEAAGLVERDVNPSSRREVVVRLTRAGAALLNELRDWRINSVATALDGISVAGQEAIIEALNSLRDAATTTSKLRGLPGGDQKA
jgi:DNA-binding MarR family transcriptional regulator